MGRKQLLFAAAAVGLLGAGVGLAQDQPKATGVVAVRQAAMKANGDHMAAIKAILTEYPQLISHVEFHVEAIKETVEYAPDLFPPGSDQQPTWALPAVWSDQAGFKAAAEKAEGLAEKLGEAAQGRRRPGDPRGVRGTGQGGLRRLPRRPSGRRTAEAVHRLGPPAGAGGICSPRRRRPGPIRSELARGELLFHIGGCTNCHTAKNGALLAGGDPIVSPYGDFYAPNITPDPETGIGGWTLEQFTRAMREGRDPEGWPLYPAFPYTSYTRMTDEDLAALKAYLDGLPAVSQASKPHDLWFPFNIRWGLYSGSGCSSRPSASGPTRPRTRPGTAAPIWCSHPAIAPSATRRGPSTASWSGTTPSPARS